MLNRAALLIRYKQPFVDWINAVDPTPGHRVILEELDEERTVYLVEVEDKQELREWLNVNWRAVLELELSGWYTDPRLWPKDLSLKAFEEWCSWEFHSVVVDTCDSAIFDDDIE